MRVLALILARGGSKRLPKKNILPLLDLPLIGWSGRFAAACSVFSRVILSTDDAQIAKVGQEEGLDVPFLRPKYLATDTASSTDVALHALDMAEAQDGNYDAIALLQPTNPFRRIDPWVTASIALQEGAPAAVGVAPTASPPHHSFVLNDGVMTPLFNDGLLLRGQDLPQTVYVTGSLYLIRSDVLRSTRTFFPQGTAPILLNNPLDVVDIDTEADFCDAEFIASRYGIAVPARI